MATNRIIGLLVAGLAIQVVCCIVAVLAAPRTDYEATGPVESGDQTVMLVGILGFGLGGVLSLIAVIALGVMLGMQAHAGRA
ncbi:hypothetical protein HNR19_001336 [Nocardioides thalensis]|uniref:Uncharacterized protein n=1 Tax=Nocardioides thalensis TaxID=1914755 RepID=A0A853C219_9ACTN|nr:hypothetical protein [Nocardioides thalensis]NYJ00638.1 hypothetical protein [Nocardioides thalensis]